ncbi:MAG: ABC transporter ATP-binding protein [Anaerolineae bacterium]|nr:ABC transporter ATP-binding protein [Anaerolineae bacterium]
MAIKGSGGQRGGDLVLQGIAKTFPQRDGQGEVRAVDDISLTIHSGEFVTLLGPSGCGKTTTLRLIAGFELPTAGKILLNGKDISNQPPNKRDMSMVFQSYALFPHMRVFDNIAYGLQTAGMPREQIRQKVEGALALMDLRGLGDRRPNELSGGQQQRVALARSLVMEPSVLLFDEPLSNLDAKLRVQMRAEIRHLQRRLGITSVYVTHDQIEAMSMSDRIVVMHQGKIEQIGTPQEIYRYPRTRFVADFIGRANFVETQVEAANGDRVTVRVLGRTVSVPMANPPQPGTRLTAVLRPESLSLDETPGVCPARIEQMMYLGAETEYMLEAEGQRVVVIEGGARALRGFTEGQTVGIVYEDTAVHLLPPG